MRVAVTVWPTVETLQPAMRPLSPVGVRPLGNVSVTVTVPAVGPLPELVTVIVYGSLASPCVKLPV